MMPYMLAFIEPELDDAVVGGADDESATTMFVFGVVLVDFIYFILVFRRFTHSINIVYKLI
jgi:hypothetical protein